jgi:hypothetical protein
MGAYRNAGDTALLIVHPGAMPSAGSARAEAQRFREIAAHQLVSGAMADYNAGEVWLDGQARPVLLLSDPILNGDLGLDWIDVANLEPGAPDDQWAVPVPRTSESGLDEDMHVNCRFLMATQPSAFHVMMGRVDLELVERINHLAVEMETQKARNRLTNRVKYRDIVKFDFDVALSFSGADRQWADQIAKALVERQVRVYYDEYEKADQWGKDLVQHLDEIYRKRARYCVILVSSSYAANIWTNHELKSALARSITQNEEYLLPARLDDTSLPGLHPTIAYVPLTSHSDVVPLADMVLAKIGQRNLINYAEFSPKWIQNIIDINSKWGLDCLAFCVDSRYLVDSEGDQFRIGISYGINTTAPRYGFLEPPEQEGENVFGLHSIGVRNRTELFLWDQWQTSLPTSTWDRLEDAVKAAYNALADVTDSEYALMASHSETLDGLYISPRYLLDEFDIVRE